jgi:hypothetical protein
MRSTSPAAWTHPYVCEDVFYPPHGFVLEHYYIESREDIVVYEREHPRNSISTQKIRVNGYRSSGNYSVEVVEYGGRKEDMLEEFSREVEEGSLAQAIDLAHVVAARVVTSPTPA